MKALRVVGIAVVAMVGLLALAVGVLFALFDGDKIKAEIERAAATQMAKPQIGGTVG